MKSKSSYVHKIMTLGLAGSILLSGCSSNEESEKAAATNKEEKTLRILTNVVGGKDPEEHQKFEEEIERLTGIKVEMEKPPADYDQKLLASMSSGEKFDLVYLTKPMLDVLVEQGVLTDLTKQVEKSKILSDSDVIPEEEWDLVRTEDDKIYGVFNKFEGGTLPTVRQDWMDKLGLEAPDTLDGFYEVLKAFKEKDPDGNGKNDTYGLSTAGLYDIQGFMSAEGVKYRYVIEDGKRTIPYATEAAVPVYEWFAKLYKDGILDPNFATNDSGKMRELFLTDRVGMVTYWDAWVGLFNNIKQTEDPQTTFEAKGIAGAESPDGKKMLRRGDPSLWAVPVNAEQPDTAMEFLEFWHSEEGNILGTLGIKDHDYTVNNGKYELTETGKEHGMDHGAPFPNNTKFENPIGTYPGAKEAQH
ncbi:extracellular solute-binding protein [Bacillus sp. T33-2]|uniref:extracellular solute-binding protein n=1 Tax=Bacillus sp. T33-2 TaxID=2054168 RepID=UPI002155CE4E|nr:extracellular solute-binding protein [Bacillus sp. T33-2]